MQNLPIKTIHLFQPLNKLLIELLEGLSPADWDKPTIAKLWTVKDIAAHILDVNFRTIAMYRDNFFGEKPENINSYQDLIVYLDQLNADWVKASKRLSPKLLADLLTSTGELHSEQLAKLDPEENAMFSVAWAGEEVSKNWFHIAREYTEKFIHHMQIRDAVNNKEALFTRELFYPFIATFMYGLPHTYRNISAEDKTVVEVIVETEIGGSWFLVRFDGNWVLDTQTLHQPVVTVSMSPDIAWKLFSKGISGAEALEAVKITGDEQLGKVALGMVSIMG